MWRGREGKGGEGMVEELCNSGGEKVDRRNSNNLKLDMGSECVGLKGWC